MDTRPQRQHTAADARQRVAAWLAANGINPNETLRAYAITIITLPDGTRAIRHSVYVPGTDGLVRERRDTPLTVELVPED